jgi:hypothetical protein
MTARLSATPLTMNLLGEVEHPASGSHPYRVDRDGHSYVPVGDGGLVLGVELGDGVFAHAADHVAPGVCLVHPDPSARAALTALSGLGDLVTVRTGAGSGATGVVAGKRGEAGRVVVWFRPEVLAALRPGDQMSVRAGGQGTTLPAYPSITVVNVAAPMLQRLPVRDDGDLLRVAVRAVLPSKLMGNGVGRPSPQWDIDLQLTAATAAGFAATELALGDLVALTDVDARWNIGFRRGWTTVGVVVHGGSPMPGHGPGMMPLLSAPPGTMATDIAGPGHLGFTRQLAEEVLDGRLDGRS